MNARTPSPLAAVLYERGFRIDDFMISVVSGLRSGGIRVGGVLQENVENASSHSTMMVVDMLSGERFVISQNLGLDARGCRLDPRGLLDASVRLDATVSGGLDLLVINKFGRGEAEGGGLRGTFAAAIESAIPVLTAVRAPYIEAWAAFHGGLSADLAPDIDEVMAWCRAVVQPANGNLAPR